MEFTDKNKGNVLLTAQLPSGFACTAELQTINYQSNMSLKLLAEAKKDGCLIAYRSGDAYFYQKKTFNGVMEPLGSQDPNGNYFAYPGDLKTALDQLAESIAEVGVKDLAFYDVPPVLEKRLSEQFEEYRQQALQDLQRNAFLMPMPIAFVIRNYLCDSGLAVYEAGSKTIAIFLCRQGMELDILNGSGIHENIAEFPFGQVPLDYNVIEANASWQVPYYCYMISERKEDLAVFAQFAETVDRSPELKEYIRGLSERLRQENFERAKQQAVQDQTMFAYAMAQQNARWDQVQSFGQSLSQDLDAWRLGQQQQRLQSDQRFNTSVSESSDERIQRLRHESIMGVETYDRNDGTTVEYDNQADRVFENNLDSTAQFGTRNYFDSYVPEGWHELSKKK